MPGSVILATASYDHTIRFWEAHTGKCKAFVQHPESQVNKMEITPDRQFLAAAGNPNVRFFEIESRHSNAVVTFSGHTNNVTAVGFQKEGKWMYTGSEDGTVKIWDINAPGCQREIKDKIPINTAVLHPNQAELFVGYQDGTVKVFDLSMTNKPVKEAIPEDDTAIRSLSVSPDGSLLCAVNNSGNCFIWNLLSPPLAKGPTSNNPSSTSAQTHTSNFDYKIQFQAHKTYILKCLFSPNGKLLATAGADNVVKLWQYNASKDKWEEDKTLIGHSQWVWDCCFSADSAYLLTASSDQVARLWDLSQGETVRHYSGHTKAISCAALNDLIEVDTHPPTPVANTQQRRGSQSSQHPRPHGNIPSPRDKQPPSTTTTTTGSSHSTPRGGATPTTNTKK